MEILLGMPHLAGPGGVQTYAITVAIHLELLGHGVWLWAEEQGEMADLARSRGLRVAATEAELPARVDAVLAQDGVTALTLAARYPKAARAIVVHGVDFDVNFPPQLGGVVQAAVVLNGRTEARMRAAAVPLEVMRLRQPIDQMEFKPVGPMRARPGRVLLLGNYLDGPLRDEFVARCREAGLTCLQVGRHGTPLLDPRAEIARADIVVGQGRCLLEAMSCGRAAYVLGPGDGDGWITAESYAAIEADGFRGNATDTVVRVRDFVPSLARFGSEMGEVNRSLVIQHHQATDHADALATLLARLRPAPPPVPSVVEELARAKRAQYAARSGLLDVQRDLREAHSRVEALEEVRAAWQARALLAEARLQTLTATRRWRFTQALAKPLDRARALLRRR